MKFWPKSSFFKIFVFFCLFIGSYDFEKWILLSLYVKNQYHAVSSDI